MCLYFTGYSKFITYTYIHTVSEVLSYIFVFETDIWYVCVCLIFFFFKEVLS